MGRRAGGQGPLEAGEALRLRHKAQGVGRKARRARRKRRGKSRFGQLRVRAERKLANQLNSALPVSSLGAFGSIRSEKANNLGVLELGCIYMRDVIYRYR